MATGVAARDEAVAHLDAQVRPHGHASGGAEVDVVGVRNHNEHALDQVVGKQSHTGDGNGGW